MSVPGLRYIARQQWADYARFHQDTGNLAIHLCAVPLFWCGAGATMAAFVVLPWWWVPMGIAIMIGAIGLQALGHRREPVPAVPFTSPANAVARLGLEQFVTFPRHVLSGRAFQGRHPRRSGESGMV